MNYNLSEKKQVTKKKGALAAAFRTVSVYLAEEKKNIILAFLAIILNSGLNLAAPFIVGHTIDTAIRGGDYNRVFLMSAILLAVFLVAFGANFVQMRLMGSVAQRMLFRLRNNVFTKLQELPVAFFNQNKIGDLISRINSDTDKLNQFFSETLMRLAGSVFIIIGAGIFIIILNPRLGVVSLAPALLILIFTRLVSAWVKKKNSSSLKATGSLSAEIQESLNNFKVIIAFNRRDYFRTRFHEVNKENFSAAVGSGIANGIFTPVYEFFANAAQLLLLGYGIFLITQGHFTIGLLVSFLIYLDRFYTPLRQLAALWASMQTALAAWERVADILELQSDLVVIPDQTTSEDSALLSFKDVSFHYPGGENVLRNINITLEKGKTYALVGPTGGGKTTTASLMARLFDPTAGAITFNGRDLRSYEAAERVRKIGFILQEPFLFSGTIQDNLLYGYEEGKMFTSDEVIEILKKSGLETLLARFPEGLQTEVRASGDTMSLGQKQLVAFMRAVLRRPELLILDEATANIDTVTEQLLEEVVATLPATTTRVIIAHRLNTIENADEIFFVNSGEVRAAGSMEHAVNMLLHHKRAS